LTYNSSASIYSSSSLIFNGVAISPLNLLSLIKLYDLIISGCSALIPSIFIISFAAPFSADVTACYRLTFSFSYSSNIIFIPTFFKVSSSGSYPPCSRIYFSKILICFFRVSILSSAFSNSRFSSGTVYSLFTFGAFLIFLARAPNRRVLRVSASLNG
jgi:hypothetical protein